MVATGPQWNKAQLAIALELSKDLTATQVAEFLDVPLPSVYKIQGAIKKGFKPDLSPQSLANAPDSPGYMGKGGGSHGETLSKKDDDNEAGLPEKVPLQPKSGFVSLGAIQIKSQYTPIMYMARLAAEDKWGWPGNLSFEDFIDTCLSHFFKDRGIILQGYIVEDDVNGENEADIVKLKEQMKEMQEAMKAATS